MKFCTNSLLNNFKHSTNSLKHAINICTIHILVSNYIVDIYEKRNFYNFSQLPDQNAMLQIIGAGAAYSSNMPCIPAMTPFCALTLSMRARLAITVLVRA